MTYDDVIGDVIGCAPELLAALNRLGYREGQGALVAYRWRGEPEIHWQNYIPHDPAVVAPTASD